MLRAAPLVLLLLACGEDVVEGGAAGGQGGDGGEGGDGGAPPSAAFINELRSTPPPFIELHNPGDEPVDLSGHYLLDDAPDEELRYDFPLGTTLEPGAYLVVEDFAFLLANEASDAVVLRAANGTLVDQVSYPPLGAIVSWCRWPDAIGEIGLCAATPGEPNELLPE